MKITLIIVACLLVVGGAIAGLTAYFARSTPGGAMSAFRAGGAGAATPVRVEPVKKSALVEVVNAPGQIEAKTQVKISARVAARVAELPFKEGDTVTKGDPKANPPVPPSLLVRLDSKDLEATLRSVQARYNGQAAERKVSEARIEAQAAQLEASKVALVDAERNLRRQKQLYESRDISEQEVEQAQAKVDQLRAELRAAEHQLRADRAHLLVLEHTLEAAEAEVARAREDLSYSTITSPINGVITKIDTEVGELVVTGILNSPGTVLMEVADLSKMLLVARVDESSIAAVKVGQKANVRVQAYPDEVFAGIVESVALAQTSSTTDGSKYYEAKVLLKTEGRRILSGLTADVDIETQSHQDVFTVPSQSVLGRSVDELPPDIRTRPQVNPNKTITTVVYRVVDGKATATPVIVGPSDLTDTIIKSGLSAGDQVIVGPYKILETISHGQLVQLEQPAASPPQPAIAVK